MQRAALTVRMNATAHTVQRRVRAPDRAPFNVFKQMSNASVLVFFPTNTVYLDPETLRAEAWPSSVLVDGIPDIENVTAALKTGPYGRCAYECDNDVCDNQVRVACLPPR